jgi:hypothetical protein
MRGITSTISVAAFHADWMTHMPMRALCERWTISRDQVIRLAVVWELPRRHDRKLRAKPVRQRDPTTTEIQQACIRIQATWSKDVEEERRVVKSQAFSMKRIPLDSATRSHIDVEYNGDCDVWEERP